MSLIAKLHPLLLHFPIALVLAAAGAELLVILTKRAAWRVVAVVNLRAGAATALFTAIAGWRLSSAPFVEPSRLLEWHGWLGVSGAAAAIAAALASARLDAESRRAVLVYQAALLVAAALIAVTGHLGGMLVWGVDFLRS